MPNYALRSECVHGVYISPGGLVGEARGCDLCGSYTRIRIVQLPDDSPETRPWAEVKALYIRLERRLVHKGPVVVFGEHDAFPAREEDHRGAILWGYREFQSSRLWCSPCLMTLWDRMKQRRKTLVDRSTNE